MSSPFQSNYDDGYSDGLVSMAQAINVLLRGESVEYAIGVLSTTATAFDVSGFLLRVADRLSTPQARLLEGVTHVLRAIDDNASSFESCPKGFWNAVGLLREAFPKHLHPADPLAATQT